MIYVERVARFYGQLNKKIIYTVPFLNYYSPFPLPSPPPPPLLWEGPVTVPARSIRGRSVCKLPQVAEPGIMEASNGRYVTRLY